MKWELTYYVGGRTYKEYVQASNREDAVTTGNARNPKAKLIASNPIPQGWLICHLYFLKLQLDQSFLIDLVVAPQKTQEIDVIDIPIDEIKVTTRLRSVSEEKVDELVESIRLVGLLHPLVVSKQKDGYRLLSGAHRRSALLKLNRKTAPCSLHVSDETVERLVEVTENCVRHSLDQIQVCDHIVLREELLSKLGKRSSSGDNRWNRTGITNEELAQSMGLDKRSYLRKKSVSKNLHPEVKECLQKKRQSLEILLTTQYLLIIFF